MEETQAFFHFTGQLPRLLLTGLTIATTKDLALLLTGLLVTAFLLESLQRISRECLRKVPLPSRTPTDADPRLKRRRSDTVPLTSYMKDENAPVENSPVENSSCLETEDRNGTIPTDNGVICVDKETTCCSEECERIIDMENTDEETTSLVDTPACCLETPEMSEEQNRARREKMWKSLSLDVLADRWEMLQTTGYEERDGVPRRITRSYRVVFHFLQTVLSMCQLTIGYIFMLIAMTYNAWFLICIVGGAGLGYLVFSSDLERVYSNYAEYYIKRKAVEEEAKRKTCTPPCRKLSWKKKLMRRDKPEISS